MSKKRKVADSEDETLASETKADWSRTFDPEEINRDRKEGTVRIHAYHGNSEETKVAIVTETPEKEKVRVKDFQRANSGTEKIKWKVFLFEGKGETVIKDVIDWGSTNLVINIDTRNRALIEEALFGEGKCFIHNQIEYDALKNHFQRATEKTDFFIGALKDTYLPSDAFLMSCVKTTDGGWKEKLIHLIKEKAIINGPETVVTVITGTHGNKEGKSGFTDIKELDPESVKEDLKIIKKLKLEGEEDTNQMTFKVIDIENYQGSKSQELCKKILDNKTTILILAWCHSGVFNGDVCNMLRSNTVLSKLVLEAEMRHSLKIPDPQLDQDQQKVLKMAREKKDLVLCGTFGTGKTVLGCEAAKIKIAKLLEEGVRKENIFLHVYTQNAPKTKKGSESLLTRNLMTIFEDMKVKTNFNGKDWFNHMVYLNVSDIDEIVDWNSYKITKHQLSYYIGISKEDKETVWAWKSYNPEGKHHIVLIDEIEVNEEEQLNDISLLSNLDKFQFILLLKPPEESESSSVKAEEIQSNDDNQHVQQLQCPYRCAKGILAFANFARSYKGWQTGSTNSEFNPVPSQSEKFSVPGGDKSGTVGCPLSLTNSPSHHEESLSEEYPPVVFWLSVEDVEDASKLVADRITKLLEERDMSREEVFVVSDFNFVNCGLLHDIRDNSKSSFNSQHQGEEINLRQLKHLQCRGCEAPVLVIVCRHIDPNTILPELLTRARKLVIIVTEPSLWLDGRFFKTMEKANELKLVQKELL